MNKQDICPWRQGALLTLPIRKAFHDPGRIVGPYLSKGTTAMDIGSGMGYFTIPMSGFVGRYGNIIAVDLQPEMLKGLKAKARRAGCENITYHQCDPDSLNIGQWSNLVDFVLIFMVLHEAPNPERLIAEAHAALKQGGKMLFTEPMSHVKKEEFQSSFSMIQETGFDLIDRPKIDMCRSAAFQKR